ncbi:MAG: Eco57I restriction-modification methylase domain-containing protein, partial [Planctomycetes bacterium]|nr:Eco57I restriction-modification methylase domain-containing protein [Planctomycetota bacterium]
FFPLRIIERLRRSKSVSLDAIREWAAASLYAIDIDPAAVFMTRTILWLALSNRSGEFLPPIRHIVAGDALLGPGFGTRDGATTAAMVRNKNRLDWQAAFPDIAAAAGFAAVIGNPPYEVLTNFSRHPERAELAQAVRDSGFYRDSLSGQINLYRCFIERGLDSLRPGGELAMVVPLSLARDAAALPLRRRLIGQCHADEWLLYGEDAELFPGVTQSACIFKAVNNGEKAERLRIVDAGQPRRPVSVIAVNALSRLTGGALTLPQLDRDGAKLLTWLADNCPGQLGQAADCRVGEVDQTIYRDCMRDDDTGCVLARGAHLSPFFLDVSPVPGKARFLDLPLFLRRKGAQAEQVEKRNGVWRIAQLGIRNMHTLPRLVAGLIPPGVYAGNSINLFTPRQNGPETVTLDFLAAMLNSSILDWLFRLGSGNNNINLHEMRRLPFPVDPPNDAAGQAAQAFRDCAELAKQRHNVEPTDTTFSANDEKYKSAILRLNRTAVACYRFPESLDELAKSLFVKDQ